MAHHSPTTQLRKHATKVTHAQRLLRDRMRQAAKRAAEAQQRQAQDNGGGQ